MFPRNLSMSWRSNNNSDDTTYLHEDFQPLTPSSKVNLEKRFGKENQYENWSRNPRNGGNEEKIYENQQEFVEGMTGIEDQPPPLPPRNYIPTAGYNTTIEINTAHSVVEPYDEEYQPQQSPDTTTLYHNTNNKGHSRSFSALQRLSVKPNVEKQAFNKSFSGHENIYYNADDELSTTTKSFKNVHKVAPMWESFQENIRESRPHASKLIKLSGRKLTQVAQGCRTAFANISQKFKSSTQKRYRLDSNSPRHSSYSTPPPGTIRCTPSKLYTPFNCSTPPPPPRNYETKRLQPRTPRSYSRENMRMNRSVQNVPVSPYHRSVHSRLSLYPPSVGQTEAQPPPPYHSHHFKRNNWSSMHSASQRSVRRPLPATDTSVLLPTYEEGTFKRHLVEFDQMSRNLTVSFPRNSRTRNSVR